MYSLSGTAIGTPPAPMYATLYFAIHKENLIPQFAPELQFYHSYIDDGFGIWIPKDPSTDNARWTAFQTAFGSFGNLSWDFTPQSTSIDFLDVLSNTVDDPRRPNRHPPF
jgi:hypothetical protein